MYAYQLKLANLSFL